MEVGAALPRLESLQASIDSLDSRLSAVRARIDNPGRCEDQALDTRGVSLVVFSCELDKLLAAFVIATGAAASGMDTSLFFTFWGTSALRRGTVRPSKRFMERALGWMLPRGMQHLPLSKLDMAGVGRQLLRAEMKAKGVASLEELLALSAELGVKLRVCTMSLDLLGLQREELIDYPGLEYCGFASFIESASRSRISMII